MKGMKGEFTLAFAAIMVAWGVFAAYAVPDTYYQLNKAEQCTDDYYETTQSQRKECFVEKDANEIGKTLVDK